MRRRIAFGSRLPQRGAALCWLIAALLLGQWLGATHRVGHATRLAVVPWAAAVPAAATGEVRDGTARSLLERLFANHGAADCVLLDQALQPSPVALPATLTAPPCVNAPLPHAPRGVTLSGGAANFEARAPPPSSRRLTFI